jgi:preprotein translocase subunit SecE
MKTMDQEPTQSQSPSSLPTPKLGRRGIGGFFKDVRLEMKKVHWPAPRETTRLTGVVMAVCFMGILILWALSTGFGLLLDMIFNRI